MGEKLYKTTIVVWDTEQQSYDTDEVTGFLQANNGYVSQIDTEEVPIEEARKDPWFPDIAGSLFEASLVTCKFCKQIVDLQTAHLHQNEWVGECCWDERLKASE